MPPVTVLSAQLAPTVDDGWSLDEEPAAPAPPAAPAAPPRGKTRATTRARGHRDQQQVTELIRSALTILDGQAPDQVALSGDGWSLVDPEPIAAPPAAVTATAPVIPLTTMIHDALAQADAEGWRIDDGLGLSALERDFFAAGDALASAPAEPAFVDERDEAPPRYFIRRRSA